MSGTNSSNSSNQMAVPQAKEAMHRFKQEVASEIGVPLKEGYNGDLTSRQAGSIGGEMVKKMIMRQEEQMSPIEIWLKSCTEKKASNFTNGVL